MAIVDSECNNVVEQDHSPQLLDSPIGRQIIDVPAIKPRLRDDGLPPYSPIVIIGGGPIGVGLACQFWHIGNLRRNFIILDSCEELCGMFFTRINILRQRVMRSPYEHQLAPDGDIQMLDFARLHFSRLTPTEQNQVRLALTGQRAVVPVDIFVSHVSHVINAHRLVEQSFKFRVTAIERCVDKQDNTWIITSDDGRSVRAKAVIVVNGSRLRKPSGAILDAMSRWPSQATSAYAERREHERGKRTAVMGGGLSAGHLIYNICRVGGTAIWILRDEERYRCADFPTSFFRTEGIASFLSHDEEGKLQLLKEHSRGSIMLEFRDLLSHYEAIGKLLPFRHSEVLTVQKAHNGKLTLHISQNRVAQVDNIQVDNIVDASGFEADPSLLPKGSTILAGGFPKVNNSLEVDGCPNLFVAGMLASLRLGPAAKNIDGARLAAQLICPAISDLIEEGEPKRELSAFRIRGTAPIRIPRVI